MRWKIIFVNAGIVVVLALITYFLLSTSVEKVVANRGEQNRELTRALHAADSQLALDALRIERFLTEKAQGRQVRAVFEGSTAAARGEAATSAANQLRDEAVGLPEFAKMAPSLVLFVDDTGRSLGRNGSALMRGDDLGATYPALMNTLQKQVPASEVWVSDARGEQLLVSYAPVVSGDRVQGVLVVGTPLNDERLARTSELTSGGGLAFVWPHSGKNGVIASSGLGSAGARSEVVSKAVARAGGSPTPVLAGEVGERLYGATRLTGYGASPLVLVASVPSSRISDISELLWPVFAVAGLGLVLVIAGGVMLGNYISRPVAEMEEGLLLVMNGQQNLRFELEHDELGGLASRINALLNSLLGVAEDNTDDDGRPSHAPTGGHFTEALAVDEAAISQRNVDPAAVTRLSSQREEDYYATLFQQYVQAKRQVGDPTDHITQAAFRVRIGQSERDMAAKYGCPVRYQVDVKGTSVVLIAVPLSETVT